ncbi:hypothetical protein Tco_0677689 [Tanacetum coccineum]|uniref:Uncharacterized protein n=1 Tax=Tanacetum coccineum TaxID=301880 RepID=A0ABQ4XDM6_9ASTR
MKKVIKEQVKSEVSKITPQIEKLVNEQLESEVLVRSSKEAKTSHVVAANLSKLELKKILIDKMEANKSISRSDIQRQLYKALVDAYEADKILLDTYGDTVTLKRPRDGADDDQEPSAGADQGSKEKVGKELCSLKTCTRSLKQVSCMKQPEEEANQLRDVYSKRRIIAVTKFKEGDFHRLRIQDIEDMLLLLVQGKLTNLNVEERLAFNVSFKMFTKKVLSSKGVEDLQIGG